MVPYMEETTTAAVHYTVLLTSNHPYIATRQMVIQLRFMEEVTEQTHGLNIPR